MEATKSRSALPQDVAKAEAAHLPSGCRMHAPTGLSETSDSAPGSRWSSSANSRDLVPSNTEMSHLVSATNVQFQSDRNRGKDSHIRAHCLQEGALKEIVQKFPTSDSRTAVPKSAFNIQKDRLDDCSEEEFLKSIDCASR